MSIQTQSYQNYTQIRLDRWPQMVAVTVYDPSELEPAKVIWRGGRGPTMVETAKEMLAALQTAIQIAEAKNRAAGW